MRTRVDAFGEQTTLSDRKRRAAQRLLVGLPQAGLGYDQRALLRVLTPAGFHLEPSGAEEPAQLRELAREASSRLPPALPPIVAARHSHGRPCPGCTDLPPFTWLGRADDPSLSAAVGRAWRRELAALGFHLHLGPACDLEPLGVRALPASRVEPSLAGPDPARVAATVEAFVRREPSDACGACPSLAGGWLKEERLVAYEKELPGLLAEDLVPVEAAVRAGVSALLVGWGRWSAFDEERPCWCTPSFTRGQLRERLGFEGLLLAEDPGLAPAAEGLRIPALLLSGLDAGLDLWLLEPDPGHQVAVFEILVKLQEQHSGLDTALELSHKRLLRARQALMLGRQRPGLEVLDSPAHRDLALLTRARGS